MRRNTNVALVFDVIVDIDVVKDCVLLIADNISFYKMLTYVSLPVQA